MISMLVATTRFLPKCRKNMKILTMFLKNSWKVRFSMIVEANKAFGVSPNSAMVGLLVGFVNLSPNNYTNFGFVCPSMYANMFLSTKNIHHTRANLLNKHPSKERFVFIRCPIFKFRRRGHRRVTMANIDRWGELKVVQHSLFSFLYYERSKTFSNKNENMYYVRGIRVSDILCKSPQISWNGQLRVAP